MIKKAIQFFTFIALILGFAWGDSQNVNAQSGDPFAKAPWTKPRPVAPAPTTASTATATTGATKVPGDSKAAVVKKGPPPPPVPLGVPPIQDRINHFKEMRRIAAEKGDPLPKVTAFLVLSEMSVSGIFKTPRGYAAVVQASPLAQSYSIYPGEKFFDGQLVAIEENRLVFRRVVKMSDGKFRTSEENKALRTYSEQEELQGTAPMDASAKTESKPAESAATASGQPTDPNNPTQPVRPVSMVSPLEEMSRQPVEAPKSAKEKAGEKGKKGKSASKDAKSTTTKKTTKVATSRKQ